MRDAELGLCFALSLFDSYTLSRPFSHSQHTRVTFPFTPTFFFHLLFLRSVPSPPPVVPSPLCCHRPPSQGLPGRLFFRSTCLRGHFFLLHLLTSAHLVPVFSFSPPRGCPPPPSSPSLLVLFAFFGRRLFFLSFAVLRLGRFALLPPHASHRPPQCPYPTHPRFPPHPCFHLFPPFPHPPPPVVFSVWLPSFCLLASSFFSPVFLALPCFWASRCAPSSVCFPSPSAAPSLTAFSSDAHTSPASRFPLSAFSSPLDLPPSRCSFLFFLPRSLFFFFFSSSLRLGF